MVITEADIGRGVVDKCGNVGRIVGFDKTPSEDYPVRVQFNSRTYKCNREGNLKDLSPDNRNNIRSFSY